MIEHRIPLERQYLELSLKVPGYYGDAARAHLAKSTRLPSAFYNYDDRAIALSKPSDVRIFGNNHTVRILGVGGAGIDAIGSYATTIADAFRNEHGKLAPWSLREGHFQATETRNTQNYAISSFVLKLPETLRSYAKNGDFTDENLLPIVRKRLDDAFERQCAFLGIAFVPKVVDFTITKSVAVRLKETKFNTALCLWFTTNARLRGPWQLGRLQGRGYGRVSDLR